MRNPTVFLSQIHLKNFRCFSQYKLAIEAPIIVFEGNNGKGKTSLLEALYYACYLRSFRTNSPKELIQFNQDSFFIEVQITNTSHMQELSQAIQIGFSHNRKMVKIDQKPISSYKELMNTYRVVSVTEDDLALIKESPHMRRTFMDQALLLTNPDYISQLRMYRQFLDQRNVLLQSRTFNKDSYDILTQKLWEYAGCIQEARIQVLAEFTTYVNQLIRDYFDGELTITFSYSPKKKLGESLQDFTQDNPLLYDTEFKYGRSLFGAHLDDVFITFEGRQAKHFSSRGQQKLIVLLIKIAQVMQLKTLSGEGGVLLLDDFMTDFDVIRSEQLLRVLDSLGCQLIFTSPVKKGFFMEELIKRGVQVAELTY